MKTRHVTAIVKLPRDAAALIEAHDLDFVPHFSKRDEILIYHEDMPDSPKLIAFAEKYSLVLFYSDEAGTRHPYTPKPELFKFEQHDTGERMNGRRAWIRYDGCEPEEMSYQQAINTFRAARFVNEPCDIKTGIDGWRPNSRINRPSGLTQSECAIACNLLLHDMRMKLESVIPAGMQWKFVDLAGGSSTEEMIEIGDGWTMAPSIEEQHGYRGAIRWNVYDPEGEPLVEGVIEIDAVCALVSRLAIANAIEIWRKREEEA